MFPYFKRLSIWFVLLTLVIGACQATSSPTASPVHKLKVVATTTIVGDIVHQVGGPLIELFILLPMGTDPHTFEPTPQDVAKVAEADVIFANGAGLEAFLEPLIASAGATAKIVPVSARIKLQESADEYTQDQDNEQQDHLHSDPHTWTDPNNVILWVDTIVEQLSALDPTNAGAFTSNAKRYTGELQELDVWVRKQVETIPAENREIVTDHALFGYFAAEYGFVQVGAIIPGYSTMAEPSARELADLENAIQALGVKAIFVGKTVNPSLAERVAQDTGTQLVYLYTGSLAEAGSEAGTYLDYLRYNVNAIMDALK